MKKTSLFIPLLALSILFTGCAGKSNTAASADSANTSGGTDSTENASVQPIGDVLSIDDDKIKEAINSCKNFKVSDNIYIDIPNASAIYEYTSVIPNDVDMKSYHEGFLSLFEYIFPNREIDEDYLMYIGGNSDLEYGDDGTITQNYNKVCDYYDALMSGDEGQVAYLYDETWFGVTEWDSQICLELGSPAGYGYANINKGKTVELTECKVIDDILNTERYVYLSSFDPEEDGDWSASFEYVATYSPDSTESFKLLNGEIPINEAVDFFEEYIDSMPYPEKTGVKTSVIEVDVLKVNDDAYGYYFQTTKEYEGVHFDHLPGDTTSEGSYLINYAPSMGFGFMIETDDVDVISSYYRSQVMESVTEYTDIISLDDAVNITSERMSDNVDFEVTRIEMVYIEKPKKTSEGYIDIDNYSTKVTPAWKIELYNPNDALSYYCYLDAVNGTDFTYYSSSDEHRWVIQ